MRDTSFNLGFIMEFALTIWAMYAVWGNLVQKRITRIGFDGFVFWLISLMAAMAKLEQSKVEQARKTPLAVRGMGIMMVLVAVGGIWDMMVFAIEHGWFRPS